jgi:protein ImuB
LPLVLLHEHRVSLLNAAAAEAGVKPGHKRATAMALAARLVVGEVDERRDAEALQAAGHAALAFTPSVTLRPAERLLLLEVRASLRYFGGLPKLLQRLQQALQPLGHALQIATAPTALGAGLLARHRAGHELGPHTTDRAALAERLHRVPVWLVGPGREHWEALQGMGLHTLADLRSLPRAGIARRFGPGLLLDLDRAYGDQPDPNDWITLPPRFSSRLELFARADTTEQVLHGAAVLLQRLVAWVQAQHARVGRFTLRMHHEPRHREGRAVAEHSELAIGLAEPSADAAHLQLLLKERLARSSLAAPSLELSLHCDQVVQGAPPNQELFPTPASEREGLGRLIERLQARLGREQVLQVQARSDHRPECAGVLLPAEASVKGIGKAGTVAVAGAPVPANGLPFSRPVWLLPEPEPLPERQFKPQLDGQPLQLLVGPERIETGWWDGALAQRDYFVALAADGALVWIYRDRLPMDDDEAEARSGWFLQGRFG